MEDSLGVQVNHFSKNNINPNISSIIKRKLVKIASLKQVHTDKDINDDSNFELQA